jgi:glycosyltransferase involved in cell wall biosynthesis
MRILFLNFEYPPLGGGGGVVMAALARELARSHAVTVLTSGGLGLPAEVHENGVRVLRVPVFFRRELAVANFPSMLAYLPMAGLRAWRAGLRGQFDVVNTHFVVPTGPIGQWLADRYGIPNVLSVHGGDLYDPSKGSSPHRHALLRVVVRRLLRQADALVGQSRDTLKRVVEIYGETRAAERIPLGIERPPRIDKASREAFGLPADGFVMVTLGRVVARKAVTQLVSALHDAARPKAHLLVLGDGPESELVRRRAAECGVLDRVHLLGQVSEQRKFEALSVADVFVSSSQHEGFGLVFLEAMAFGLPIVCYDRGGQTDFLAQGRTGSVIALNDLPAFTRAIVDLHDDPVKRESIGAANLRLVEEYFIDRCAQRYEAVYTAAIREHGAPDVRHRRNNR